RERKAANPIRMEVSDELDIVTEQIVGFVLVQIGHRVHGKKALGERDVTIEREVDVVELDLLEGVRVRGGSKQLFTLLEEVIIALSLLLDGFLHLLNLRVESSLGKGELQPLDIVLLLE